MKGRGIWLVDMIGSELIRSVHAAPRPVLHLLVLIHAAAAPSSAKEILSLSLV